MAQDEAQAPPGPDLRPGVKFDALTENEPLLGHFDGEPAILVRQGEEVFAIGAVCSHYSGPLAEGPVVEFTDVILGCLFKGGGFAERTGRARPRRRIVPAEDDSSGRFCYLHFSAGLALS